MAVINIEDGKAVLAFLNKIEGHGYGGTADFEIAREAVKHAITCELCARTHDECECEADVFTVSAPGASACSHCGGSGVMHETVDGPLCSPCLSATMDM